MPATFQRIPQEPIIVITLRNPFNPLTEMGKLAQGFTPIIAEIDGPVYLVIDATGWKLSFSDLVHALDIQARDGISDDPRVHTIFVGRGLLASLAAKATAQKQYLGRESKLFESVDEALTHIRAQLA